MREALGVDSQCSGEVLGQSPYAPGASSAASTDLVADFLRRQAALPIELVSIDAIEPADSPRRAGEDDEHVRTMALSEVTLPPIIVHRSTMRVIDGMHRLKAAILRGRHAVEVRFFDGDSDAAFVLAVQANISHGLPLALSDRTAAARRILESFPEWSDRRIAESAGLSPKTVGTIRAKSTEELPHLTARVGRDGRVRRIHTGQRSIGTMSSEDIMCRQPGADPAESAAIPLQRSVDAPLATPGATIERKDARALPRHHPPNLPASSMVSALRKDPSLRFTDSGRLLLRLLDSHSLPPQTWDQLISAVPPHCAGRVAELAFHYSIAWHSFASRLADERSEI
jgi:ParB-like nuclease family protein